MNEKGALIHLTKIFLKKWILVTTQDTGHTQRVHLTYNLSSFFLFYLHFVLGLVVVVVDCLSAIVELMSSLTPLLLFIHGHLILYLDTTTSDGENSNRPTLTQRHFSELQQHPEARGGNILRPCSSR